MPSPSGIFAGLPLATLQALRDDALDKLKNGARTSLSGGGKSGSKQYANIDWASLEAELKEIQYAINKANGTLPPRQTQFDVHENTIGFNGVINVGA